ncbi:MAG TPA: bifunctional pyr operon transcriptional regulator/uracil phosphoribosyltransferase PyrR [Candidatus Baltobacteraceae bacterium]|nr:bifunctional pyr operon transcriptional regulator/uracil phosphoribosyltransferase PyrR [Candidatus Baltobacteraceae bacterium]
MTTASEQGRILLGSDEIARVIARLAHQILEPDDAQANLVLIGIRRGGEALATRLAGEIERISGKAPALGFLNINLYRDDRVTHEMPESQIPVDINDRVVVVVDDVLFTGRTIRAALDAVTDLGRPAAIRLCVFIDRGLRELPVQGDYVGRTLPTSRRERIKVCLASERSPSDEVVIHAGST